MATGEIHDLGYQRYVGARKSAATRWRVIARYQIATAWKTWWRYKVALVLAGMVMCVWGGLLWFFSQRIVQQGVGPTGKLITQTFQDSAVPMSVEWFCRVAFYLTLTLGAGTVARDVQTGAFTFYFARSLRPRDYVLGKLAGYGLLVWLVSGLPLLVLAGVKLGIYETSDEVIAHLDLLPRALGVGAVIAVVYTVVPLGLSALLSDRRTALALWAAYYLVFGTVMYLIARFTPGGSAVAALDLPTACLSIGFELFRFQPLFGRRAARNVSLEVALISIAIHALVAIALVWWRVSKAQKEGVGSS